MSTRSRRFPWFREPWQLRYGRECQEFSTGDKPLGAWMHSNWAQMERLVEADETLRREARAKQFGLDFKFMGGSETYSLGKALFDEAIHLRRSLFFK